MKCIPCIAIVCCALLAACQPSGPSGPESLKEPLKVGMDLTYPPFEFKNAKDQPDGVSVKLAESLAKSMGRELQIESMPFEGLIAGLSSGKIDLVISSMTATDERREAIDFSDPYVTTELAILVGKESDIQSIEDLKKGKRKIAVRRGTTGEAYITKHVPNAEPVSLTLDAACAMEVAQGKAEAWVYDQLSIWQHHKNHPEKTRAILKSFQQEQWAVGIAKTNPDLKEKVNAFLKEFKAEGGFAKLGEAYLSKEKAMQEEMGVPFLFR